MNEVHGTLKIKFLTDVEYVALLWCVWVGGLELQVAVGDGQTGAAVRTPKTYVLSPSIIRKGLFGSTSSISKTKMS